MIIRFLTIIFIVSGIITVPCSLAAHTASLFTPKELALLITATHTNSLKKYLFWHQKIPTVGLRFDTKPLHNFIPHQFSLWQLAPKKGSGIKIAVIDTGIALRQVSDGIYAVHPQLMHHSFFCSDFLNIVNRDMQELLLLLNNRIAHYSSDIPPQVCTNALVSALHEYSHTKTVSSLHTFLKKHHCFHILEDIQKLVMLYEKRHFFTSIQLTTQQKPLLFELLPCIKNTNNIATHGTALCGIIGAGEHPTFGPIGIAPSADIIMIRAFNEYGVSTKAILLSALKKAYELGIPIVNISLKIADSWDLNDPVCCEIEKVLTKIPYVVAASGNSADAHAVRHEAYPARLPSVAFDVGAFTFDGDTHYAIAPFSQYEHNVGPKVVAPGFNIISTTLTDNPEIEYGFFSGTSVATALITGFVALMLSEFGEHFTREQLLKVCYKATVQLHATKEWKTKTLLGTIDMRCALFMLHALVCFKELMALKSEIICDFERDFDGLVLLLHTILNNSYGSYEVVPYFVGLSDAVGYVVGKMFLQLHSDVMNSLFSLCSCKK